MKFNKIRLLLNDSNIKEDIFRISILAKNWSGKIPTNFIQDFNIDEFRLFKNLYIYQYSNPDEFSDDDLQEKIINYYFPIWQRIVFYMYLTGGYNRERFLKHFLDNYIIIDRQDLKICLEITYDEYEIGKHLYNNSNFFHNHLLSSEERLFFEGIGYNIIDKLFNLYKEKEGF
jgi:hypothetical protein